MNDEGLKEFQIWLEGTDPSASLITLRWVQDFLQYVGEDEEDFRDFKKHLNSQSHTTDILAVRRLIADYETNVEPDDALMEFEKWLEASLRWVAAYHCRERVSAALSIDVRRGGHVH